MSMGKCQSDPLYLCITIHCFVVVPLPFWNGREQQTTTTTTTTITLSVIFRIWNQLQRGAGVDFRCLYSTIPHDKGGELRCKLNSFRLKVSHVIIWLVTTY